MICEFCNNSFSSVSSLNLHKRTNKKCLSSRTNIDEQDIKLFQCKFCTKKFTSSQNLLKHSNICKNNKDEIIKLREEITRLNYEIRLKDEQLKMKDDFINILQNKSNSTSKTITNNNNKTIINIQATKELLDKMMPINRLNENMLQDENFKHKLHLYPLSDVVSDYIVKNNAVYVTDYEREKGVVMVENQDSTMTPRIGVIPQLLSEHKICSEEPFENILKDIRNEYKEKVDSIPNDEQESKLSEIIYYQGKARQCAEDIHDIKNIQKGNLTNSKLYNETSKNVRKTAKTIKSNLVKKIKDNSEKNLDLQNYSDDEKD